MNRTEFTERMKANHIPDFCYNLTGTGNDDERYNLVQLQDGTWEAYYGERGHKNQRRVFGAEEEALAYIAKRLLPNLPGTGR